MLPLHKSHLGICDKMMCQYFVLGIKNVNASTTRVASGICDKMMYQYFVWGICFKKAPNAEALLVAFDQLLLATLCGTVNSC
jgi:hypothetical protein